MSQAQRGGTPLELLQEWSAQVQHNEEQHKHKVKSTLRRQATRKGQLRRPALQLPASPTGDSPAADSENAAEGGNTSGGSKKGFGRPLRYPSQTSPQLSPSPLAGSGFGRPGGGLFAGFREEGQPQQEATSGAVSPGQSDDEEESEPAYEGLGQSKFGSQQQHHNERPTSPPWLTAPSSRAPSGQHGLDEAFSAKPSWRQGTPPASPPPKVLSPSAAQQRQGLQRTPPATPGSRLGSHLSPGPSPAAGKRTPSAPASQQQTPVPSPGRLPSAAAVAAVAALGGSPGRRRARQSPRPALHLLFPAPQDQQEGQQGSTPASPARLPVAAAKAAPTPLSKLVQEASPARLIHQGSPVGTADFRIRAGPAVQGRGLQRQRELGLAALAVEAEEVQEAQNVARPSAEGSEEDAFYSAAPSRTASQAVVFSSALNSPRASPAGSTGHTVLQRLEQTATALAGPTPRSAGSSGTAEEPAPAAAPTSGSISTGQEGPPIEEVDDYNDLDALLLGKPPSPVKSPAPKAGNGSATPPPRSPAVAATPVASAAKSRLQAQQYHGDKDVVAAGSAEPPSPALGRRSPANLFGLFASRGAPCSPAMASTAAEGTPPGVLAQGPPSPLRQRLLSGGATLLNALGWGGAQQAQSTEESASGEESGAEAPGVGDEAPSATPVSCGSGPAQQQMDTDSEGMAPQLSLPSNPFDMLAAEESSGRTAGASPLSPAVGRREEEEEEVRSLEAGRLGFVGQRSGSPSPMRRRRLTVDIEVSAAASVELDSGSPWGLKPQPSLQQAKAADAGRMDALRTSVASSCGAAESGDGPARRGRSIWAEASDGAAAIATPTRLQLSKDNPLYEPFGSSFAPPAEPPGEGGSSPSRLPATNVLRAGIPSAVTSPAHPRLTPASPDATPPSAAAVAGAGAGIWSSPRRLGRGMRSRSPAQQVLVQQQHGQSVEPGSAYSTAAKGASPVLETVLEQADEGASSPEVAPRSQWRPAASPASTSFAQLEQQAEAWAEAKKPSWTGLAFQLPPLLLEEEGLEAGRDPIEALDEALDPPEGSVDGDEGPSGGSGAGASALLANRDAASHSALWQAGPLAGADPACASGQGTHHSRSPGKGSRARGALGPLAEAMSAGTQLGEQQCSPKEGWLLEETVAAEAGAPREGAGELLLPGSTRTGGAKLEGWTAAGVQVMSPVRSPDTMPLRYSLAATAALQWQQEQQQLLLATNSQSTLPRAGSIAAPGWQQQLQGRKGRSRRQTALRIDHIPSALPSSGMTEPGSGPREQHDAAGSAGERHMGRSISLGFRQREGSLQEEEVVSRQSYGVHQQVQGQEHVQLHSVTVPGTAAAEAPAGAAAASGRRWFAGQEGHAGRRRGMPGGPSPYHQQLQPKWGEQPRSPDAQAQAAQHGWGQSLARQAQPLPAAGVASGSAAAVFQQGLSPLEVAFDQVADQQQPLPSARQQQAPPSTAPASTAPLPSLQQQQPPPSSHGTLRSPGPPASPATAAPLPSPGARGPVLAAAAAGLASPTRHLLPSAGLRSPQPGAGIPASTPVQGGSSPDIAGRTRSNSQQPKGKRYSPESQQYHERLKHQGEVISSLYLRRQLSGQQELLASQGQRAAQPAPTASLRQPDWNTPQPAAAAEAEVHDFASLAQHTVPPLEEQQRVAEPTSSAGAPHDSSSFHTAQPVNVRESASFHTAHGTPQRFGREALHQQQSPGAQQQQLRRVFPSPQAKAALAARSGASSPSPVSRLRPAAALAASSPAASAANPGQEGEDSSDNRGTALRFGTPQSKLLSSDEASAAEQGAGATPGAGTPHMTPLTAISKLRANLARGGAGDWEGQQQQMQSILSRLETRVRETRTRAKSEAEKRSQLEEQVYQLESRLKAAAEEAGQASNLKWELTSARQQLEALREENLKLQKEREGWEAQLATQRERVELHRSMQGSILPQRRQQQYGMTAAPVAAPVPAVAAGVPPAALSLGPTGLAGSLAGGLSPRSPRPPPYSAAAAAADAVLAGDPDAAAAAAALAEREPFFPQQQPLPRAGRGGASATSLELGGRAEPSFAPLTDPRTLPQVQPALDNWAATDPSPRPLQQRTQGSRRDPSPAGLPPHRRQQSQPWEVQPGYGRQPPPPLQHPDQAGGGRWSAGTDYSDPATAPWSSTMLPDRQQQQPYWGDSQQQQEAGYDQAMQQQQHGPPSVQDRGWGAPPAARHPRRPKQEGPPRGSTWDPCTPQSHNLQNLLRVAGDSNMFRPLYTGAQQMDSRPPRQGSRNYSTL
ncbi:hypothetical protein N2152v2_002993 [Parachlorella kessleri]